MPDTCGTPVIPYFAGRLLSVVAVRLQPVRMLAAEAEPRLVDQRRREHVRVARGEAVHAHLLVTLAELAAIAIAIER